MEVLLKNKYEDLGVTFYTLYDLRKIMKEKVDNDDGGAGTIYRVSQKNAT